MPSRRGIVSRWRGRKHSDAPVHHPMVLLWLRIPYSLWAFAFHIVFLLVFHSISSCSFISSCTSLHFLCFPYVSSALLFPNLLRFLPSVTSFHIPLPFSSMYIPFPPVLSIGLSYTSLSKVFWDSSFLCTSFHILLPFPPGTFLYCKLYILIFVHSLTDVLWIWMCCI